MSSQLLLRGATVITMEPGQGVIEADILIEDDVIAQIGPQLHAPGAQVRELGRSIVLPGLVDAHAHLWQGAVRGLATGCWGREYFGLVHPLSGRFRPADMYASTIGTAAEMVRCGTTTVFDFCHATNSADHAEASLRALDESGIRGVFGFCFRHRPEAQIEGFDTLEERREVLHRLVGAWRDHGRVSLAVALNNLDHVSAEVHQAELAAARGLGLIASLHSNLPGQIASSAEHGTLNDDLLWVHAGSASTEELRLLAEHGGAIVVTPEVEATAMGIVPSLNRAAREQVGLALGTDVPAVLNGSMFEQLRMARALSRLDDVGHERAQNRSGVRTSTNPTFDCADILRLATIDGARALGLGDQIGSIVAGKQADLLVVSTEPFGLGASDPIDYVVMQATARQLTEVYVAGQLVVRDGEHQWLDLGQVRRGLDDARDWVLGQAPGSSWPALDAQTRARYEAGQGKAD